MAFTKGNFRLVSAATGDDLEIGDRVKDFRGDTWILRGGMPQQSSSSTGHVYLSMTEDGPQREFYANVIEARWHQNSL